MMVSVEVSPDCEVRIVEGGGDINAIVETIDCGQVEAGVGLSHHHQQFLPLLGSHHILDHLLHDHTLLHLRRLLSSPGIIKDQVSQSVCATVDGISPLLLKLGFLVLTIVHGPGHHCSVRLLLDVMIAG